MPAPKRSLHDRTLATIGAFYDAALDETLWPTALKQLTDLTGSQAATFWVLDRVEGTLRPTFRVVNFDMRMIDEYLAGISRHDPTVRYLLAHPDQPIVHDGLLGPGTDPSSRMYQDWHEQNVETRFRLVGQAMLGPELQAGIALHRTRKAGRYERADLEQFDVLHQHLKRALTIGARMGALGTLRQLTTELLDDCNAAILLLDPHRRVVFLNQAAEQLRDARDGLQVVSEGLRLARPADNELFESLVSAALQAAQTRKAGHAAVMRAARLSGRTPYGIHIMPMVRPSPALTPFRPAVCVIVSDPARSTGPTVPQLQALFRLTQAEARLAACLATGTSLRAAAEELGITYGTARSRLMQVFEKTGTRSQSDLMRLLLTVLSVN
jgi:DNA-binding CsgD family transcriptional regulator